MLNLTKCKMFAWLKSVKCLHDKISFRTHDLGYSHQRFQLRFKGVCFCPLQWSKQQALQWLMILTKTPLGPKSLTILLPPNANRQLESQTFYSDWNMTRPFRTNLNRWSLTQILSVFLSVFLEWHPCQFLYCSVIVSMARVLPKL